jgi:DNA-binding FadR family transcriptional regulator
LKRLQQAGLVAIRHGGATQVLDWRTRAGLEMLPRLLTSGRSEINEQAVLGVMALRSALAPAIAAAAARNANATLANELDSYVKAIAESTGPRQRQVQAHAFWTALVGGSGNIAFQLAFNSLDRTYRQIWNLLTVLMDVEFRDTLNLGGIAGAIRNSDADSASRHAAAHVALGEAALGKLIQSLKGKRS